jgi:hypothetical protein
VERKSERLLANRTDEVHRKQITHGTVGGTNEKHGARSDVERKDAMQLSSCHPEVGCPGLSLRPPSPIGRPRIMGPELPPRKTVVSATAKLKQAQGFACCRYCVYHLECNPCELLIRRPKLQGESGSNERTAALGLNANRHSERLCASHDVIVGDVKRCPRTAQRNADFRLRIAHTKNALLPNRPGA